MILNNYRAMQRVGEFRHEWQIRTQRAIADLQQYLAAKAAETKRLQESLLALSRQFNHRQLALLQHAIKNPHARFTVISHAGSHDVVIQTARNDLQGLEQQGLLTRTTHKRGYAWTPSAHLADLLEPVPGSQSAGTGRTNGRGDRPQPAMTRS